MTLRCLSVLLLVGLAGCATDSSCGSSASEGRPVCLISSLGERTAVGSLSLSASSSNDPCACPWPQGYSPPPGIGVYLNVTKSPVDPADKSLWTCVDVRLYLSMDTRFVRHVGGGLAYSRNQAMGQKCETSGIGFSGGPNQPSTEGLGYIATLADSSVAPRVPPGTYEIRVLVTLMDGTSVEVRSGVLRRM